MNGRVISNSGGCGSSPAVVGYNAHTFFGSAYGGDHNFPTAFTVVQGDVLQVGTTVFMKEPRMVPRKKVQASQDLMLEPRL